MSDRVLLDEEVNGSLYNNEKIIMVTEIDATTVAKKTTCVFCLSTMCIPPICLGSCFIYVGSKNANEATKLILTDKSVFIKINDHNSGCPCCHIGASEKCIPLNRITDVTVGLKDSGCCVCFATDQLVVQTAGSSLAELSLAGVHNALEFKQAILRQKSIVEGTAFDKNEYITPKEVTVTPATISSTDVPTSQIIPILNEIKDTLKAIERNTDKNN